MANTVCSKCNVGWQILAYDQYCGYCGCKIYDYAVKWKEESQFFRNDKTDTRKLEILVENSGASPLKFQPIKILGEAIQPPDSKDTFEVKPGESYAVEVLVDPTKLTTQPEEVTLQLQDALPNLENKKSLTLQALPLPEFKIAPNSVSLSYPKSKKEDTIDFTIEFQGEQFAIESIESSNEWITRCDLSKAPSNIRLDIDCTKLKAGGNSGTLSFKLRGPSKPFEKQIQVHTKIEKEPAELSVVGEDIEVIQDRENKHTFRLSNKGEQPLEITKIECDDSSNLIKLQNNKFPIVIEGIKQQSEEDRQQGEGVKQEDEAGHNVDILISTIGIGPGTYPINFQIHSNCYIKPEYQYTLSVTVRERKEYWHYLAIDFGTTNSCCAYLDDNTHSLEFIPLEDWNTGDIVNPTLSDIIIMPSSIIYRSQPEDGKDYDIGSKAVDARTDSKDGPYYISSVKRWLGFGWNRQFPNDQQLQPVDVVSHILKHIINKAEDYLEQQNLPSKITRCAITYPTKFDTYQQDALRQAFEKIGITDLILIDEASAASMGIIFENSESLPEDYRLLVYDFGGGTIDIVLSEVAKNGNDITIEPIARGGDPRYGGDDVTQVIVDYVLSEYRRRIEAISPGHDFDIPYFDPRQILPPSGKPDIDNAKRQNTADLYRRAEDMKKDVGNLTETEFGLDLNVVEGTVEGTSQHLSSFVQEILAKSIQDDHTLMERTQDILRVELSENQFQELIAPALNKTFAMIDTMIVDNGERLPDLVVLAGQSSRMRFVKKMMENHFKKKYEKDIEIRRDHNPKTCVVMGAAEYSRPHTTPLEEDRNVKFNLLNKTHTRFGIERFRMSERRSVFGEIIGKGKLIPDESHGLTNLSLKSWLTPIKVYEHFGSDESLDEDWASSIGSYNLKLPEDVTEQELKEAQLKMAVELNGEITLTAIVSDEEYPYTVKREQPAFVTEIPRTTPVINAVKPQTISPYQREAEEAIRNARQQVMELARNYRNGEPIDLDNIFTSTPSQKALLNLNTIARDLCQWISELRQTDQTDLLQTLSYAEQTIKDKLKTIRGENIPPPKTLDLPADVSTNTAVNRIRNECADYVAKFEGILRSYELEREVDTSICEQFIQNQLFNNLTRYILSDSISEKLDKFLQLVDLEIVPIEIGITQVDSRVHDIQGSEQTGVKRETIAEIIKPGLKKRSNGASVQKPVVIRGE